jgi:tRNA-Thr(GGU) m(6)t(6)A37 methyltransferase TsaA
MNFEAIGIVHSSFKEAMGTHIQPKAGKGIKGTIEVFPEFEEGLKNLEGFSHIILVCHFHLAKDYKLEVIPFLDNQKRGVFATRAPSRPNPIGISVVRLKRIENNILYIQDVDIIDGTPLLDIKPYVPEFDSDVNVQIGWLEKRVHRLPNTKDDGRFRK